MTNRRLWRTYFGALCFAALIGGPFGAAAGAATLKPAALGAVLGAMSGLVDALTLMALIGGMEIFVPRTPFGRALARAPLLFVFLAKFVIYIAIVAVVVGGRLGPNVALLAVDPEAAVSIAAQVRTNMPRGLMVAVAATFVALIILLRQMSMLVGERTARDVALGRYSQPRFEERFFLFVDIVGSTPVAERLGPLSVHKYLDRIFQIASDPIDDHAGDVYQYVGDEIIVTWTVANGREAARPIKCLLAIDAALALAAPEFERGFGTAPRIRAALHAGEVVTGEVGGSRRSIVFHGDVMNTTSRIENLTREVGHPFLVSEEAIRRIEDTAGFDLIDLGHRNLRGREATLRVYALQAAR